MNQKILKVPMSCRISPELKEDLELEAIAAEVNPSAYLEGILKDRNARFSSEEEEETWTEMEEELYNYNLTIIEFRDEIMPSLEVYIPMLLVLRHFW
ncbi:MAG: hypothetical protein ACJAYJ_003980 [Saprospiraceae bacterium]|jgi:hypothetical protein